MDSKVRKGLLAFAAGLVGAAALAVSSVPAWGGGYQEGGYKSEQMSAPSAPAETRAFDKFNLNSAGVEQLAAVPGIGNDLAGAIVKYRDENGPFSSVDDLLKVKGIGETELKALRDYVTLW